MKTETRVVALTRSMVDDGEYPIGVTIENDGEFICYSYYSAQFAKTIECGTDADFPLTDADIAAWIKEKEHADFAVVVDVDE